MKPATLVMSFETFFRVAHKAVHSKRKRKMWGEKEQAIYRLGYDAGYIAAERKNKKERLTNED